MRVLLCCCLLLSGCAAVMNSAQQGLSRRLEAGVLGHDDPTTVAQALPAYLVLVDGLIDGAPDDAVLACTGAKLYAAYAGTLVEPGERAQRLAARARRYAATAACTQPGTHAPPKPAGHPTAIQDPYPLRLWPLRAFALIFPTFAVKPHHLHNS